MYIEIEAKLKVDSFKGIEKKLKRVGAEFLRQRLHTDAYFDDKKSTLRKSDSAIRIRHQEIGRRDQVVITFKGPRRKGRYKQRQEIQFEVGDAYLAEMFLAAIGIKRRLCIRRSAGRGIMATAR
jgi:predicted adenylyl cyclase CyaB